MEYIYGNPNTAHSWKNVASIFAAHDSLNSAQTSSLPLVQFWRPSGEKSEGRRMREAAIDLLERCFGKSYNGEEFQRAQLCFEYAVPVHCKSGRGKASMTDLMILTKTHTIAVEAKWTECHEPYQTITDWFKDRLRNGATQENLVDVLNGWIKYINEYVGEEKLSEIAVGGRDNIIPDHYQTFPYQLLHRIASACAVARKPNKAKAVVIYQLFYNADTEEAMRNFATQLADAYGKLFDGLLEDIPFFIVKVKTEVENTNYLEKIKEKCNGNQEQYDWNALFLAMQKSPIYKFSDITLFPFDQK